MIYLTNVGPRKDTKGGYGSRGYYLDRRGNTVIRKWGRIEIIGKEIKVIWKYVSQSKIKYSSNQKAIEAFNDQLSKQIKKGYKKLSLGKKIYPPKIKFSNYDKI